MSATALRRLGVERRDALDALDVHAAAEAARALLLRDRPPVRIAQPQPQQVTPARGIGPVLEAAAGVQHHEIIEELDVYLDLLKNSFYNNLNGDKL